MRIAFVTFGCFDSHATLKRATGMATPLLDKGHKVYLLLEDAPINREKAALECPDAKVIWHRPESSAFAERSQKQKALDSIRPDVVWICGVGVRNWMSRTHKGCLVLADHSELYSVVSDDRFRKCFYWFLEWAYCFAFDGHICASRFLERFYSKRLQSLGRKDRIHYSPYAFHPGVMSVDREGGLRILKKYGGKKVLLYMGSFWENYGFWDMLHVFKQLSQTRTDFVAVLAGRGPEKEEGLKWVSENGLQDVIRIEGYIPEEELSAYFTATHAFLSPLRDTLQDWARCPSKLYMYLPFEKPVVTCRIGEAAELFGSEGTYYSTGDRRSLEAALLSLLDENAQVSLPCPSKHTYSSRVDDFIKWHSLCLADARGACLNVL